MEKFEEILEKLISEHNFLKDVQERIVGNYDIMIQNQQQNANNHEVVIQNQQTIIRNQEIIVNNQINIVRNQKQIAQNQISLEVIQETQTYTLNLLKKMMGSEEPLGDTKAFVAQLRAISEEKKKGQQLNDPSFL
ncbi:MAG: hypothetical protein ACOVOW_03350 [Spirosomataceae bacterium]|jgi:hypothetical protein